MLFHALEIKHLSRQFLYEPKIALLNAVTFKAQTQSHTADKINSFLSPKGFWTIRDGSSNQAYSWGDPPDIALRIISVWVKPSCPGLCLPNETPCPWFLSVLQLASLFLLHPGKRRRRGGGTRGGGRGGNESKRNPLPYHLHVQNQEWYPERISQEGEMENKKEERNKRKAGGIRSVLSDQMSESRQVFFSISSGKVLNEICHQRVPTL